MESIQWKHGGIRGELKANNSLQSGGLITGILDAHQPSDIAGTS